MVGPENLDNWKSKMCIEVEQGGNLSVWFKTAPEEAGVTKYELLLYECVNGCGTEDGMWDELRDSSTVVAQKVSACL